MKWEDLQTSENIEDRRGEPGGGMFGGPSSGGGIGLGTIVILGVIGWALGINPSLLIGGADMLSRMGGGRQVEREDKPRDTAQPNDQMGQFVGKVLGSNEQVWSQVLPQQQGVAFRAPRLVLFDGVTNSRCGTAQSAMGPFYCPIDQKIYLDTSFFRDMKQRFGGGGDFAYAYVISHEMGHHIENLLG
ncbi:MAG: neutral zinc metallopeptidase, partial [Hyphomicrobiales bacterium]